MQEKAADVPTDVATEATDATEATTEGNADGDVDAAADATSVDISDGDKPEEKEEASDDADKKEEPAIAAKEEETVYQGLQVYDTANDYDEKAEIYEDHRGNYSTTKVGMREVVIGGCDKKHKCSICRPLIFNPLTTLIGFAVLLGFALWCITDPINSKTTLGVWQSWCTKQFTWFYIASQNVWIIFLGAVYYQYGHVRLAFKETDRPEFDNATYFAMLFSAGVAVGLFVFGTAEPLYHYDYWVKQRFNGDDETMNDKANYAILTTIFHWGFHGWCVYTLVGLQMGLMAYRKKLPLTMRSCFYPLLGKYTWGWIGDCIDGFSIVTIVAGVCTSLGLGAVQIQRGLVGMNAVAPGADGDMILLAIIWGITAIATVSVVSGVHVGIKTLSQLAFSLGLFILVVVFFAGSTQFYMNNMSSSVGYYFHYAFTKLGWHTDAYAQLEFGEGASPDMKGASKTSQEYGGSPSFMDGWTIFYWGWWIAWSPFVGMFVARISRGRTVREIINYTMTGPLLFCFLWFGVFGGAAIQMENQAQMLWKAGVELYNDPSYFQAGQGVNKASDFSGGYVSQPAPPGKTGFGSEPWCWKKMVVDENSASFPGYCGTAGVAVASENAKGCIPRGFKTQFGKGKTAYSGGQGCGACFVQQATFGNATHDACAIHKIAHPDVTSTLPADMTCATTAKGANTKCSAATTKDLCTAATTAGGGTDLVANACVWAGKTTSTSCPFWIKSWKADAGLSPQCLFTDYDQEASWYNVVGQFYSLGPFLQGLSILTLTFYFVTSSDSGSLVVDTLSAGGRDEQNPIQRVIWALIEGLVATGLVLGGSGTEGTSAKNVLKALQAASICCGLPFTFLLCFMMPALWYGLRDMKLEKEFVSTNGKTKRPKHFKTPIYGGVFDSFEWLFSFGHKGIDFPSVKVFGSFFLGFVFPFVKVFNILGLMDKRKIAMKACGRADLNQYMYTFASLFCWVSFVALVFVDTNVANNTGFWSIAWALFACNAIFIAVIRMEIRARLGLAGNAAEDFFSALCFHANTLHQMEEQVMPVKKD